MPSIKEVAEACLRLGISVMPISTDTKQPMIKWKHLPDGEPLASWDYEQCNIGLLTGQRNGIVAVECDTQESAAAWYKSRQYTPMQVLSPRGRHFWYRHPGQYVKSDSHIKAPEGFEYDVKGDRSYIMIPPSQRKGKPYRICRVPGNPEGRWIKREYLPVFQMEWRPERVNGTGGSSQEIRNLTAILRGLRCGEGERDKMTFRAARLAIEANYSEADAIEAVLHWHTNNCSPPWEAHEIIAKVRRVYSEK